MRIGIVGGALQGMEAVYLSRKAGFETTVIDRRESAPATRLADSFEIMDVLTDKERVRKALSDCDAVLPAFEELDGLIALDEMMNGLEIPFLFDLASYRTSCSKERSNAIMGEIGVPIPKPWPECGFPAIVKPSSQSGSIGVSAVNNEAEMDGALDSISKMGDVPVVQEFVSGKSVSIEVIGNGTSSASYVTTEVMLDENYDCKQVVCEPNVLPKEDSEYFAQIGEDIANAIGLNALMDVEAVFTRKGLRVLEIDARIPSQTPAAVYAATGVNLLKEWVSVSSGKEPRRPDRGLCAVYEHYVVDNRISTCGEKEFGRIEEPQLVDRFFGADEAITDYVPGSQTWRATVMNSGRTPADVLEKRKRFLANVMEECDVHEYMDRSPRMV